MKWYMVSLFTREWIEIESIDGAMQQTGVSPSLRGSGLKLNLPQKKKRVRKRLPLYEGVD